MHSSELRRHSVGHARTTLVVFAMLLSFVGGIVILFVALTGPLGDLAGTFLFSAHMIQHLLLTLVVAPLLLAGTPARMLDTLLARLGRAGLATARWVTRPVPGSMA